jgi:hypothetical protein
MIYTIELRRAQEVICSISDRFEDDSAALADAKTELSKSAADEAKVFRFDSVNREPIAVITPDRER